MSPPKVRPLRAADIPEVTALQRRVYPTIPSWSPRRLADQLDVFPQGQVVAEADEGIVGYAGTRAFAL